MLKDVFFQRQDQLFTQQEATQLLFSVITSNFVRLQRSF